VSTSASRERYVWLILFGRYLDFKGKSMLVPLTSSLYVPGKITDPEHVVVDIGTGYYVKKVRSVQSDGRS
jgi:hypothetical protein